MMGGYGPGSGFGPGMMGGFGRGMMNGFGAGGAWSSGATSGTPVASMADARKAFQVYLDNLGNSDLQLGDVEEFQYNYYGMVKEKSTGNGAFALLASKPGGVVFLEPGPNMMWNTKYGHGAFTGPATPGQAAVNADKAKQLAQQWLDTAQPDSAADTPDVFPGYYTVDILKDGKMTGMLSVNGTTGEVWYHTWHGAFVASSGD
jgi:hypothetical protein